MGCNVTYPLRNSFDIRQYYCRTEKFKRSLIPSCIGLWNKLDSRIRNIKSSNEFKIEIGTGLNKSIELYNYGQRKENVIHAQMRMLCSNLRAHLKHLHVVDDATCICSQSVEDNYHFFFSCPLYVQCRADMLATISQICYPNLETILYGNHDLSFDDNVVIFEAVHSYIGLSERFT